LLFPLFSAQRSFIFLCVSIKTVSAARTGVVQTHRRDVYHMLELLRRAAKTWVAKVFFILLVGSFAIWGVSRSMVSGTSDSVVVVGDQKVNTREFRMAYERQIAAMSQQFGTQITSEQARAFGIDQQVLSQLVAGAALDQLSHEMNLGLSQKRLAQMIADEPAFKSASGQFDRALFQQRLRNAGLREDDYIKSQSKSAVRGQIVDAVADGFKAPETLVKALTQYRMETRGIDYLLLSNSVIAPVKAPDDAALAAWFNTKKDGYKAPEYRKISYVKLAPADIMDLGAVSDQQIRDDYEKHKDQYRTVAKRTIEQLTFPDKASANAAADKLAAGTSFDDLVKDQGKTKTDVLLGEFAEKDVPDQVIGKAAFAVTAEGGTTPVIDGTFGPVIARVTGIKPEVVKSLDEVKDSIRKDIALGLASEEVLNVHDRYEDARASGSTMEEAAKQLKLTVGTIEAVDSQGLDMKGNAIKDVPESAKMIAEAFKTDVNLETDALALGNDGYVWFQVDAITPERERPLAEVRDRVVADWTAEQQKLALTKKAEELVAAVKSGKKLADIATELAIAVETKSGIKRGAEDPVLSMPAIAAVFAGPIGHVANAEGVNGDGQIVLVVTEVNADGTSDALNDQTQQITALAASAGDDILDQMVDELKGNYGTFISQQLAQQAMVR
jgi:peptidyl-prolyl cis-trans isomerase D